MRAIKVLKSNFSGNEMRETVKSSSINSAGGVKNYAPRGGTAMNHELKRVCLLASIAAAPAVAPGVAGAAGFALLEQNASGLGNAYAGSGAVAADGGELNESA
jgi:hypothetical protein